jgi:nucleoside 2-deoxyribosyltransferase
MMKVYLAAAWHRREEIRKIAQDLRHLGVDVQARWLDEREGGRHYSAQFLRSRAIIDVHDVRECDILIRFSDDLSQPFIPAYLATGSRMFEMGYAYAQGKPIIVVGGHQPVFDYLPNVVHLANTEELKEYLGGL